jgi:hypothetical protein
MAAALLAVLVVAALLASWLTSDPGPKLTIEKPTGGTIIATGITCGTGGSSCTTTASQGDVIELRVQPDDEYTFASYTGDCAPAGRVLMDGPHTCGATFEHTPGATTVRWPLTLTPPTNGTIFTMEGHACGSQGKNCVVEVAEGHRVSLDVQADEGFRVQSYTGDCAPDGTTTMDAARTCGAVLVPGVGPPPPRAPTGRDVASAGPGTRPAALAPAGPGGAAGTGAAGAAPVGPSTGVETSPAAPPAAAPSAASSGGGVPAPSAPPRTAEVPVAALPPAGVAVSGPPPPVRTPTELATKEITTVLFAYRDAHSRMDVDAMKRQFPSVDVPRFQQQFRDLKSLTYAFAGDPKLELDLERGRATAVVDVKTENESKAGKKQKPVESKATFLLQRIGITDQWHIELIKYQPK